jgi:hypothetical protein
MTDLGKTYYFNYRLSILYLRILFSCQALQSQNRGGLLPLGGGAFNNQSSFNSNRGRDFTV